MPTPTSLVTLGRRAAPEDLLGLLLACHARIRAFSALALDLATQAEPIPAEVAEACERLRRYFAEALPLHARDEEESLAPRLRGRSAEVDEALRRMTGEHDAHLAALDALLRGWATLRARPDDEGLRRSLEEPARALRDAFEAHLRHEETLLFPHVDALSQHERDEAVRELRGRRRERAEG